jgi:hypothetical protein
MLKFYNCYIDIFYKDKEKGHLYYTDFILEESEALKKIEKLTWENIPEIYQKHGYRYPFTLYNGKKGKRVSFVFDRLVIKEWVEEELNIRVEYTYEEKSFFSIIDIMKYRDVDKAIQFLKERGLEVKG